MRKLTHHFYIVFIVANLFATITFGQVTKQEVSEHLIEFDWVDAKYLYDGSFRLETIDKKNFIPEVQLFDFVYDTHPITSKIRVASYQDELFVLPSDFSLLLDKTGTKLSDISFFNMLLNAILSESDQIENIYQKDETYLNREFNYHAITWEEINGIRKKWSLSKKGDRFDIIRVEILEIFNGNFIRRHNVGTPGVGNVSYINFTHVGKFEKGQVRFPVSVNNNDGEKISFIEQGDINDALKTENVVVVHNGAPTSEAARTIEVNLSTFTPFSNVTVTIDVEQSGVTHQIYSEVHTVNAIGSRTFNVVLDPTKHTGKYTITADGLVFTIVRSFFVYRTRTGTLPEEADYQYRIFYGSQFAAFDTDSINSLVTEKEDVLTNVYNTAVNQWGFPSPKSIDADNFLDQYFGSFDNYFARRIMNCPNIEFGYFYAGLPRIEYYVSNFSYTDALEFMHAADVHEFLHSVQYTYPDIFCNWTGSTQEPYYSEPTPHRNYIIEGQARFLQTVYLNTIDPDKNAEFELNSMYWNQSVNYLIGYPGIGMLPGLSRGLGLLSYDYAIFWRFLYENNNPSGSDAARLSIITEVLNEITGSDPIAGAQVAFDNALSNIGGNYGSYAEAKKEFAKRIYLNDCQYGLWDPCPSDAFYPKPHISASRTLPDASCTEVTGNLPVSFGIDYIEVEVDDDVHAVETIFNRDPDQNGHGDFYVNLILLQDDELVGEVKFDANQSEVSRVVSTNNNVNKIVAAIVRLDVDENDEDKADYQIRFNTTEPAHVEIAICLDRSGSMNSYGYMVPAKNASKAFVDLMQYGDYLAVTSFAQTASVNYPFSQLNTEQDKINAKNAIDNISAGGLTSIGAGMQLSQAELNKGNTDKTQAMILLGDGFENRAPWVSQVLPTIPFNTDIYTIALGPQSDQALLNNIAVQTGGFYSYAPNTSRLALIYNSIRAKVTGQQILAWFIGQIAQWENIFHNVFVDGGTSFVNFSLTWPGSELGLVLTDPDGNIIDENVSDPNIVFTEGPTYKIFSITNPLPGEYEAQIIGIDVSGQSDYDLSVTGESTLAMDVSFNKSAYGINEPILITAEIVDGEIPVTGATVTAEVTVPAKDFIPKGFYSDEEPKSGFPLIHDNDGNYFDETGELRYEKTTIILNDNGDGTYSNYFSGTSVQGSYSFDVFASGVAPLSGDFTRIDNQSTSVTTAVSIVVTGPQTGSNWFANSYHTVQWSSTNITGNVDIHLSTNGGSSYPIPLALDIDDHGSASVFIPYELSSTCRIRVRSVNNNSISGVNPGNFSIIKPALSINPETLAVPFLPGSTAFNILFSNDADIDWVIESYPDWVTIAPLSGNGVASLLIDYEQNTSPDGREGIITVNAPDSENEQVSLTITQAEGETIPLTPITGWAFFITILFIAISVIIRNRRIV